MKQETTPSDTETKTESHVGVLDGQVLLLKQRWTVLEIKEGVRILERQKANGSLDFKENRLLRWLRAQARKFRIPSSESDHARIEAAEAKRLRRAAKRAANASK